LHERIIAREIEFARISTKDQLADGFTKALPGPAFTIFRAERRQMMFDILIYFKESSKEEEWRVSVYWWCDMAQRKRTEH
jgi:hypothetical protein